MANKNETKRSRISRLVGTAFYLAETGEEKKARSYWKSAINSGYTPTEKAQNRFEFVIAKGIKETRACPGTESGTE